MSAKKHDVIRIGVHVRKGKYITLEKAISHAFEYYSKTKQKTSMIKCVQIHSHGPHNTRERRINIDSLINIIKNNKAHLIIHSSMLTYPWKDTSYQQTHINQQIKKAHILHAYGIVIHLPIMEPKNIMPVLKKIITENNQCKRQYKSKTIPILEMISQKPTKKSYETPEKINCLIATIKKYGWTARDIGICIDTAHIFVNHDDVHIRSYSDSLVYLKKIKYPTFIKLIHLNGNTLSSYKDCHTIPFLSNDLIWKGVPFKSSGVLAFIRFAKKRHIDVILEMETLDSLKIKSFIHKLITV